MSAYLYNPYTGEKRDLRDVVSDPQGLLIVAPGEELKAAKGHKYDPDCVCDDCLWIGCI